MRLGTPLLFLCLTVSACAAEDMAPLDDGDDSSDVLPRGSAVAMPTGIEPLPWHEETSGDLSVIEARALPGTFGIQGPIYRVSDFSKIESGAVFVYPDGLIENFYNSRFEFKIFRISGGKYQGPIALRGQVNGRAIIRDSFTSIDVEYGERGLTIRDDDDAVFELGNYDYFGQTGDNGFDEWGAAGQIGVFPYPVSTDYGDIAGDYSFVVDSGKICCKG